MKIETIHIWSGLFANFCVVLGIVFLAIELNQNSQMMAAQTRADITENVLYLTQLQNSPEMRDVRATRRKNEELNADQLFTLQNLYTQRLRHWENMVYQFENELFVEEEMEGVVEFIRNNFQDPLMQDLWVIQRPFYSQNFAEFIYSHTSH